MAKEKIVVKTNGDTVQINLNKVVAIWVLISGFIAALVGVVVWVVSVQNYMTESFADRDNIRKLSELNSERVIEINYNLREYMKKDDIEYEWKNYLQIQSILQLKK